MYNILEIKRNIIIIYMEKYSNKLLSYIYLYNTIPKYFINIYNNTKVNMMKEIFRKNESLLRGDNFEDNIIKGKGSSFLKSSYELLFVQKDILTISGRETEIYFENNNYIVDNDQKYILFLMSIQPPLFFTLICYFILFIFILIALNIYLPKHCEFFIPSFLLNNTKFIETFEKMRKKKIIVSSIMFLAYNIIYSILCNTNEIHTLRTNLKNIHK
ncbi:hypothetical protein PFTANZ_02653 [Plasmodium falciparum Tanzania (2000708)]|uniref:Uncharacterized protein n=1 Tax=Plasmodium falciparum Tanzania (2000708) TaxID=1036725 RepID=A0A024W845_PLAFA|nr:hypothetical protein PFTANZ_02653 [Plasmodium falciparum Tanzania (2000708)]